MVLFENAHLYAHQHAAQLLRRDADPNRPQPATTFADSLTLDIVLAG